MNGEKSGESIGAWAQPAVIDDEVVGIVAQQDEAEPLVNTPTISILSEVVTVESVKPQITRKLPRDGRKSKEQLLNPKPKGGRGHFSKHLKTQLTQAGKLNAKEPMSEERKRKRRSKRR